MLRRFYFVFFFLAVVLLSCSGDNSSSPPPGNTVITVEIHDDFFQPKSVTVNAGTTVRWVLRGSTVDHTVTDNRGAFDSGFTFKNQGDIFERRFDQAGETFSYACQTHGPMGMLGSVRVGNTAPQPDPGY